MKNRILLVALLVSALRLSATPTVDTAAWTRELSLVGNPAEMLSVTNDTLVFDSALCSDPKAFRWAGAEWSRAWSGDFDLEAEVAVDRFDRWNGFRLVVTSLAPAGAQALLSRTQEKPGAEFLTAQVITNGVKGTPCKIPFGSRTFTLGLSRHGGRLAFFAMEAGRRVSVAESPFPDAGGVRFRFNFDSPAGTRSCVRVKALRLSAAQEVPAAFAPAYGREGSFGPCALLAGVKCETKAGVSVISPGGRLVFAAVAPPVARDWALRFKSAGRLRIRALQLGSAESIQLSDSILWDDVDAQVPAGYATRCVGFSPYVLRFPSDVRWPLAYPTTSGVFFFEVSPAGDEPVRFGEPDFRGRALVAPPPLAKTVARKSLGELPVMLGPTCPSVTLAVDGLWGAVEVVHFGGRQKGDVPDTMAGWLFVYEDGTTSPAFATLRWNCGVNGEYDLEWSPAQGGPDGTWFGPPGFGWGEALYAPANAHGTHWSTKYRTVFRNPHPEKRIAALQVFQLPEDARTYMVCSVRPVPVEAAKLELVEPAHATFAAGEPLDVNVYVFDPCGRGVSPRRPVNLNLTKDGGLSDTLGTVELFGTGPFSAGLTTVTPRADKLDYGPVRLTAGAAESSRCSLMPPARPGERPFYYTMIGGMHFPISDFDRQRRLGYDAAKIHVGWQLDAQGEPDFAICTSRFELIARAGLKIAVRNDFDFEKVYPGKVPPMNLHRETGDVPLAWKWGDTAHPFYCERLVDYYTKFARFTAGNPDVVGINANYGQRNPIGRPGKDGGIIWSETSLAALSAEVGRRVTAADIAADPVLFARYSRLNERNGAELIAAIARGIRAAGSKAHLTFNVNFHPVENKLSVQTFAEYLRVGLQYPPASLFHETSERYSLSFVKWLAAARTCGLPYGDECCQPPPTYEHAMFAYMWMGMMQCVEANYCQWWGGRPGCENLAQLKAYHRLLFDATYLPDPVCLALSLGTGHDEIATTVRHPYHTVTQPHYGLAHFLRELNVNADRYMIDAFPALDTNVTARLLIDDITRSVAPDFGARIERFVRDGGVFLASPETDVLHGHAFLKKFGFGDLAARFAEYEGKRVDGVPFVEKAVGRGKVVVLLSSWSFDWDPGRPERQRREMYALLQRLGGFTPRVATSEPCVFATPYRSAPDELLVSLINVTCLDRETEVSLAKMPGEQQPVVRDLGTGRICPVSEKDGRWTVRVNVPKINTTVLRVSIAWTGTVTCGLMGP